MSLGILRAFCSSGLSSLLLAFFKDKGVYGVVGAYFLLSWLFKYAYVLLEHVANGEREAPVVAVEMLSPFEQRPLVQAFLCLAVYLAVRHVGGASVALVTGLLLCLLPASIAVLGLGLSIFQAVNPLALWRVVYALKGYYVAILGLIAAVALLIAVLMKTGAWSFLTIGLGEIAVLTVFSALGGALFVRRLELGFEPRLSPERQMDKEDISHKRRLDAMLDEMYTAVRMKQREHILTLLKRWLSEVDDRHIGPDSHTIVQRAKDWRENAAVALIGETIVSEMTNRKRSDLAREIGLLLARTDQ